MAEVSPRPPSATPSSMPQKRPPGLEDEQHMPAVSSPLNPDAMNTRSRKAPPREQREKKESLKKREAKGVESARGNTPENQGQGRKSKKATQTKNVLSPIRYKLPAPKPTDFDPPKAPILTPTISKAHRQFHESSEHVYNRKGFRYIHCIADPGFPSSQYHRASETEPYGSRFNFEDASPHILFDAPGKSVTTEKGFRMVRANVGVREGRWYWECKILSGVKPRGHESTNNGGKADGGHVRVGWARREASLDTPVGFDAYSYGLRDVAGQKVHMSRPKDFMPSNTDFCEGDVIGLEITLPSLNLHRKVVEGSYNKAVDTSDDLDPQPAAESPDIIRDRVPIRYKAHLYFEQFEYHPTKELEELMNPSPVLATTTTATTATTQAPNPNHPLPPLRTLPFSSIKIYKNGQLVGTPYTSLLSFLPPASKPLSQPGARDGLDDGTLGYFPAISVFRGGAAEANFGPDFWCPPEELQKPSTTANGNNDTIEDEDVDMVGSSPSTTTKSKQQQAPAPAPAPPPPLPKLAAPSAGATSRLRAISSRFDEQIAEDITYEIIDEVDFWAQDGGEQQTAKVGIEDPDLRPVLDSDMMMMEDDGGAGLGMGIGRGMGMGMGRGMGMGMGRGGENGVVVMGMGLGGGGGGEIKELVQEVE